MIREVLFPPEAEREALEVRDWYEARRQGLGNEFGAEVDEIVARIAATPMAFERVRGETRRGVLKRFPYALYFRATIEEIEEIEEIVVLAVHGPAGSVALADSVVALVSSEAIDLARGPTRYGADKPMVWWDHVIAVRGSLQHRAVRHRNAAS